MESPSYLPPSSRPSLLIAVPLGARRLQERGYNQALEIARPLAALMNLPLAPQLVARQYETQAQTRLTLRARQRNLQAVFLPTVQTGIELRGQHIGIVDDVMTTGATLNELASTLKQNGAVRITNFIVARTA
ncbi:phosphoribosyltransferase family protein [Herbaspirillum sp. RTI4]|uniref:ComF family protein n=1 Tax=Herbaspirillum sp. RTI4 TaxID=3048640 RepID=UPI002AB3EBAB|nr:phosphoribosyltransferase family protein [Herbaspirillum sp. RTI4]MDY7577689.1 phosphoribosyltransferase family protein [Herbaspirillum sp. RTI4]MEA9983464.1 phosphoribosyltransferase family protein [Herbaspirillum sp. RTI4]